MNAIKFRLILEDIEKTLGRVGKIYNLEDRGEEVVLDVEVEKARQRIRYNKKLIDIGGLVR